MSAPRTVRATLAYSGVILRQLVRDRTALVFLVVLPIAIIVIIGSVFGGNEALRVGVTVLDDDPLTAPFVEALEEAEGFTVVRYDTEDDLRGAVRREAVGHGVLIGDGFADDLRAGGTAEVAHVVNPTDGDWFAVRTTVQGALDRVAIRTSAAAVVSSLTGGSFDAELAAVEERAGQAAAIEVVDVGDERVAELSAFALVAPQQLVLFVFVNSLGSAVALVVARRSGVLRRAFATRTRLGLLVFGVLLAWFLIALLQSLLIIVVGAVAFDVSWGEPLGATAVVLVYGAVGAGAGLLLGAVGRDEDRVSAIGPATGMVLGALGGCMVPLEVFPPAMLAVARLTPHYWAVTAWQQLVLDGDGIGAITGQLAVLGAFAVALLGAATLVLRRDLSHGT